VNARAFFITGTDTEVGKTFATCALLHAFRARGLKVVGMKPVAAGSELVDGRWINEDVERLRTASSFEPAPELLNPYCLKAAVAPHIAAAQEGVELEPAPILAALAALRQQADVVLVEGAGGFRVPFGATYDSAELARDLGLPIILVVGMRLGCINHALLTAEAVAARGLPLAGWIANQVDPAMLRFAANVETLKARLPTPLLGILAHQPGGNPDPAVAAGTLDLTLLP